MGVLIEDFLFLGNVSQGAQEIFQEFPFEYVDVKDLPHVAQLGQTSKVYGCIVTRSDHWVHSKGEPYDGAEADAHPERYYSNFSTAVAPYASVIVNGIYWAPNSPKLLTIPDAKRLLQPNYAPWLPTSIGSPALPHRLLAICDISADPGGSIEFMTDCTTIDNPFCMYDNVDNKSVSLYLIYTCFTKLKLLFKLLFLLQTSDFAGAGVLVCSIDNMPTQLPLEATTSFGDLLKPYIADIINSDATRDFEAWDAGAEVKGATIASNGALTPAFEYITQMRTRRTMLGKSKPSNAKTVLVLGAGYVASPLVEMLTRDENVHVIVASELQGKKN